MEIIQRTREWCKKWWDVVKIMPENELRCVVIFQVGSTLVKFKQGPEKGEGNRSVVTDLSLSSPSSSIRDPPPTPTLPGR